MPDETGAMASGRARPVSLVGTPYRLAGWIRRPRSASRDADRMTQHLEKSAGTAASPRFPVELAAADVSCWLGGNTGIAGVWQFAAGAPGPHVVVTALIHGN